MMIPDHYGKYEYQISFDKYQFTGKGESRSEAKEKAAIKALLNTPYRFTDIPPELLPPVSSTVQSDVKSQNKTEKKVDIFEIETKISAQEEKSQDSSDSAIKPCIVPASVAAKDIAVKQTTELQQKGSKSGLEKQHSEIPTKESKPPVTVKKKEPVLHTNETNKKGESIKDGQLPGDQGNKKDQLTGPVGSFIPRSLRVEKKDTPNSKRCSPEKTSGSNEVQLLSNNREKTQQVQIIQFIKNITYQKPRMLELKT